MPITDAKQWFVYLLRCADDSLYAGVTVDCKRRLREHNGEILGGARYTRARRPVVMVWSQSCENRSTACKQEAQIKKLSKKQKLLLIKTMKTMKTTKTI